MQGRVVRAARAEVGVAVPGAMAAMEEVAEVAERAAQRKVERAVPEVWLEREAKVERAALWAVAEAWATNLARAAVARAVLGWASQARVVVASWGTRMKHLSRSFGCFLAWAFDVNGFDRKYHESDRARGRS